MPRRRSGADKKQKPAKKLGSTKLGGQMLVELGRSRNRFGTGGIGRSPVNSGYLAAIQHCHTFDTHPQTKPLRVYCRPRTRPF